MSLQAAEDSRGETFAAGEDRKDGFEWSLGAGQPPT